MTTIAAFEKKAKETFSNKNIKTLSIESLLWFEREVKRTFNSTSFGSAQRLGEMRDNFYAGQLVMFKYDPKWKEELPYYDTVPLTIVTRITARGWYGINLHYCPPRIRTWIMNKLYEVNTRKNMLQRDRMKMSWAIAQQAAKAVGSTKHLENSIKQYLASHVRSRPVVIDPENWDMAVHLPTARFKKGKPY